MLRRPIKGVQAIASDGITVIQYLERHNDLLRNAEGLDDKGYSGIRRRASAGGVPLAERIEPGEGPGDLPTGLHSLRTRRLACLLPGHQTPHVPAQQPTLADMPCACRTTRRSSPGAHRPPARVRAVAKAQAGTGAVGGAR